MRRDFLLPEEDLEFLETSGLSWEAVQDGQNQWCILRDRPFPEGLNNACGSIAIRIQANYLKTGLDMAYFLPSLARRDGKPILAIEANETICGAQWQRWSRHYPWREGVDSLASHILQIEKWLQESVHP